MIAVDVCIQVEIVYPIQDEWVIDVNGFFGELLLAIYLRNSVILYREGAFIISNGQFDKSFALVEYAVDLTLNSSVIASSNRP